MSSGANARSRAAASSTARGRQSRRSQISCTVPIEPSMGSKLGTTVRARVVNSATASSRASASSGQRDSPATAKPSRLVAKIRNPSQLAIKESATLATSDTTCSQLSKTSNVVALNQKLTKALQRSCRCTRTGLGPNAQRSPYCVCHSGGVTDRGEIDEPDPISERSPTSVLPTSIASLVFPTPPGPTTVTRRLAWM